MGVFFLIIDVPIEVSGFCLNIGCVLLIRENGILKTGNKDKADIFSRQFGSVYIQEIAGDIPLKGPSLYPDIEDISIDPNGVKKLLDRLNAFKASGPYDLNARVLKECSAEIAQVLACIFNQSLIHATVRDDWRQANVAPIYKKGEKRPGKLQDSFSDLYML